MAEVHHLPLSIPGEFTIRREDPRGVVLISLLAKVARGELCIALVNLLAMDRLRVLA